MSTMRSEMSNERLEAVREYYKNYRENHRDKINGYARKSYEANKDKRRARARVLCKILKEHKEALADDPERLPLRAKKVFDSYRFGQIAHLRIDKFIGVKMNQHKSSRARLVTEEG